MIVGNSVSQPHHRADEKNENSRGNLMPNNKDNQKTGSGSSPESMSGSSNREFEDQGSNPSSGKGQGQHAGSSGQNMEDDDMSTAGGRQGNFSDKDRGDESQWSPGSKQSSDQ